MLSIARAVPTTLPTGRPLRVAFIVHSFPVATETFVIDQVANLIELGAHVRVFSFSRGGAQAISEQYSRYRMSRITHCLELPAAYRQMLLGAFLKIARGLVVSPRRLLAVLRASPEHGGLYRSQRLYLAEPFLGRDFDVVHCHFGPVARQYLQIRKMLGITSRMVTTFYGQDVSRIFANMPSDYYDEVKRESSLFFVMSENMRQRVVAAGFDPARVVVLPVSVDVNAYPFSERQPSPEEPVRIVSVGRFVEKKGFDDILRAIDLVRRQTSRPFKVSLVGAGPLESTLRQMVQRLELGDLVEFRALLPVSDVVTLLSHAHLFVQPSKTAADGDME